jgi:hypothetical protein
MNALHDIKPINAGPFGGKVSGHRISIRILDINQMLNLLNSEIHTSPVKHGYINGRFAVSPDPDACPLLR